MPPTKKQKSKSCNRGYPCGGSCISRGYNCRKKLKGQASNYADWLKSAGDRLGDDFNKEAGKRLGVELFESMDSRKLSLYMNNAIVEGDKAIIEADESLLRIGKIKIEQAQGRVKRYQKLLKDKFLLDEDNLKSIEEGLAKAKAEISDRLRDQKILQQKIADRDKQLPRNKIARFRRIDNIDKALSKLNQRDRSSVQKDARQLLESIYNLEMQKNNIVRFKKKPKGERDFVEEDIARTPLAAYLKAREKVLALLEEITKKLT